jgi:hypothetical protein
MTTILRHLIITVAVLAVTPATVLAGQKSHRRTAGELLMAMGVDKQLETSAAQMIDLWIKGNPKFAPYRGVMKKFFDKHMIWDSLRDDIIAIYFDAFNEEELKEILAFYRTPAGRKLVEKMPELTSKSVQLGVRRVEENREELNRMFREAANKPEAGNH